MGCQLKCRTHTLVQALHSLAGFAHFFQHACHICYAAHVTCKCLLCRLLPLLACAACSSYTISTFAGATSAQALIESQNLPLGGSISPTSVLFQAPTSIEVDRCTNTLYISDLWATSVFQIPLSGGNLTRFVGPGGSFPDYRGEVVPNVPYQLERPQWLTSYGQYMFIVDVNQMTNQRYIRVVGPGAGNNRSFTTVAGAFAGNTDEGTLATETSLVALRGPVVFDSAGNMYMPVGNR
jgi:hypothetical protein